MVELEYPAVTVNDNPLLLTYGTAVKYAGFDRFGRVVQQLWRDYGASEDRDKFAYGYDRNSNRKWREVVPTSLKDEFYTYDNLNRLTAYSRGDLTGSPYSGVDPNTDVRGEDWTLTAVGSWSEYKIDHDGDGTAASVAVSFGMMITAAPAGASLSVRLSGRSWARRRG